MNIPRTTISSGPFKVGQISCCFTRSHYYGSYGFDTLVRGNYFNKTYSLCWERSQNLVKNFA